jgi:hypothetical protein
MHEGTEHTNSRDSEKEKQSDNYTPVIKRGGKSTHTKVQPTKEGG